LGFGAVSIVLQLVAPVNHDLGWLLVGTRRMLDGAQLYVDGFIDVNPPMILAVLSPVSIVTRATGLAELEVVRCYVLLLCGLLLWFCATLARDLFDSIEQTSARYLMAGLVFVLGISPALTGDEPMAFGQREHFVVLFLLPYLMLIAIRLRSREPRRWAAIVGGVLACVALGMKPQYLPTLVAIECWLLFQRRSLRVLLRPELWGIAFVGAGYLISLFAFVPAYLSFVVPLALDTYWAYQVPTASLVSIRSVITLALALVTVLLVRGDGTTRLARLFWVVSLGSYVAYLLGGTAWAYHKLPFQCFVLLALLMGLSGRLPRAQAGRVHSQLGKPLRAALVVAISTLVALVMWQAPWLPGQTLRSYGPGGTSAGWIPTPKLDSTMKRYAPGGTLLVLATTLYGFPLVNHAELEWTLRTSCLWQLPAVRRARAGRTKGQLSLSRAREIDRYVRKTLLEDMRERPPDVVFVHRARFKQGLGGIQLDFLEYLGTDPAFAELWLEFEYVDRHGWIDVYARRDRRAKPEDAPG
jgi:hypothetical protein